MAASCVLGAVNMRTMSQAMAMKECVSVMPATETRSDFEDWSSASGVLSLVTSIARDLSAQTPNIMETGFPTYFDYISLLFDFNVNFKFKIYWESNGEWQTNWYLPTKHSFQPAKRPNWWLSIQLNRVLWRSASETGGPAENCGRRFPAELSQSPANGARLGNRKSVKLAIVRDERESKQQ